MPGTFDNRQAARASRTFGKLQWALAWLLALSMLATNELSLYLTALQNLTLGPSTEVLEPALTEGSLREAEVQVKRGGDIDGVPLDGAEPVAETFVLVLLSLWPIPNSETDRLKLDERPTVALRPLQGHIFGPRAPPAMS